MTSESQTCLHESFLTQTRDLSVHWTRHDNKQGIYEDLEFHFKSSILLKRVAQTLYIGYLGLFPNIAYVHLFIVMHNRN